ENIRYSTLALGAAGVACAIVAGQGLLVLFDPDADPEANRRRAYEQIEKGAMRILSEAKEPVQPVSRPSFLERWQTPLLGLVATLALVSSQLLRLSYDWPVNDGWYPKIVGPGDAITLQFSRRVQGTIEGLWTGTATARVANAAEVGMANPRLEAGTRQEDWGDRIRAPRHSKTVDSRPWVTVFIPNEAELSGKTLRIVAEIDATYPVYKERLYFETRDVGLSQESTVVLGTPGAGRLYMTAWWIGVMGGC